MRKYTFSMQNKEDTQPSTSEPVTESQKTDDNSDTQIVESDKATVDKELKSDDTESNASDYTTSEPASDMVSEGADAHKSSEKVTEQTGHLPIETEQSSTAMPPSSPPESVFKNLKPSENRYTFKEKDEL